MLLEIRIENFILIEKLNISFSDNLNIFTGETGAGKSMIFGALNFGLGEKANGECVRTGLNKAVVQLVFSINDPIVLKVLNNYDIELEDGLLILTREIHVSGRTIIRINDRISTLKVLREVTAHLIDIHGQHAHQSLLYSKNHIELLDLMGDESHQNLKKSVKETFSNIKNLHNEIKKLSLKDQGNIDINYLKFQITEIDSLEITKEDEESLEEKFNFYKNIEIIQKSVFNTLQILIGDHEIKGLKEMSDLAIKTIEPIVSYDEKLKPIMENFNSIFYHLEDISTELRQYLERMDIDEQEMFVIEQRMNSINELKLKHGKSIFLILQKRDMLREQLKSVLSKDEVLKSLEFNLKIENEHFMKLAEDLSRKRRDLAKIFSKEVLEQLKMLNMANCDFDVEFARNGNKKVTGIDDLEFIISTNPGISLKPLAKIASGGEISRVMLAIKIALASVDQMETLVFDEVDTGISGSTALIVGEKLHEISKYYQIICITHLPQIAVMSDSHFLISKETDGILANTKVAKLNTEKRFNEVARMLSGDEQSKISIDNAKEMVETASLYKSQSFIS